MATVPEAEVVTASISLSSMSLSLTVGDTSTLTTTVTARNTTDRLSASPSVTMKYGSAETLVVNVPVSLSNAYIFALYSGQPSRSTSTSNSYTLDDDGVYWSA
ncbi:MAG: hypothetical protein IJ904_06250 [Candidatus Methanomethylophilaceae archaeon]|nr:hypothetical protein [Candidatus Methanomethylophilaceae archaeon]